MRYRRQWLFLFQLAVAFHVRQRRESTDICGSCRVDVIFWRMIRTGSTHFHSFLTRHLLDRSCNKARKVQELACNIFELRHFCNEKQQQLLPFQCRSSSCSSGGPWLSLHMLQEKQRTKLRLPVFLTT